MTRPPRDRMERAAEYWHQGKPLEAGRIIYTDLPKEVRPVWASRILRLVLAKSRVLSSPIEHILDITDDASQWQNAHAAFSMLRAETLSLDRLTAPSDKQKLLLLHLSLAEKVAKVTYNATDPQDKFDKNSGWRIVACLKGFVDMWNDDEFTKAAWTAICFRGAIPRDREL